jgi:hypothetical protein
MRRGCLAVAIAAALVLVARAQDAQQPPSFRPGVG